MGIFIYLKVSTSVTKEEWEKVYEETLQLVNALPLAEKREVNINGIDTICLVPTEEREETYGWHGENRSVGWRTVGDYEYMCTAEDYYLPRDLVKDNEVEEDAGDAMRGAFPAYMDYDWDDPECNHTYGLWGNKTQGEPYHIYLLAIACLIEARLGTKAFIYGDITRGQCRKAVDIANNYLKEPIKVPDRCDMERLWNRVKNMGLDKNEQYKVFNCFYLGTKDVGYGNFVRKNFSKEDIKEYWKRRFECFSFDTMKFNDAFNDYLLWGFELDKLCGYININDEDGNPQYERFIKRVMDAKLHLKEKNCEDALKINQEESQPYSIATFMAQALWGSAKNKKVDRYIPVEEIRKILNNAFGSVINVNEIIDAYLDEEAQQTEIHISKDITKEDMEKACEQDASEVFSQIMKIKRNAMKEEREKYDISDYENLMCYKKGDSMHPGIMESLGKSFAFYNSCLVEESYKMLLKEAPITRCKWLVEQNRYILLRDIDWKKIFSDIEKNENSYARYYPMMRVKLTSEELSYMVTAIVLNDQLYEYCFELEKIYGSDNSKAGETTEE